MEVLTSGIMPQYGVDVFEDTVYWLEGGSIYATSTEPGGLVVQLYSNEDGTTLRDITVVHTSRQPSARKLIFYRWDLNARGKDKHLVNSLPSN